MNVHVSDEQFFKTGDQSNAIRVLRGLLDRRELEIERLEARFQRMRVKRNSAVQKLATAQRALAAAESKLIEAEVNEFHYASMTEILRAVCIFYEIKRSQILSNRRTADEVRPRHVAMYICRENTTKSLPGIGRFFGRDHTSVLHALRCIDRDLRAGDKRLASEIAGVMGALEKITKKDEAA